MAWFPPRSLRQQSAGGTKWPNSSEAAAGAAENELSGIREAGVAQGCEFVQTWDWTKIVEVSINTTKDCSQYSRLFPPQTHPLTIYNYPGRVHSSAVERYVHIVEVESSILSAPTIH